MPGTSSRETIVATGDPLTDIANYQSVLASFPASGGTLLIDGMLAIPAFVLVEKPIHHMGVDPESGYTFSDSGVVYFAHADGVINPAVDPLWPGCDEGDYSLWLPSTLVSTLQPLDWLYLYSEDALAGLFPHQGTKQHPGESHQVVGFGGTSGANTRVYLRDATRDAMTINPRVSLRPLSRTFRDLTIENLCIANGGNRLPGFSLAVNDVWGARIQGIRMIDGPGALAINGPDCQISDVFIGSQTDELNVYGIIASAQASNFRIQAHLHSTRHAFTTAGIGLTIGGVTHRTGTPWGVVTLTGSGQYTIVLDTHAEGKGIIFDGCDVEVTGHPNAEGGYGFQFRARNTTIRNSRIRGSLQGAMFGGIVSANQCRILNTEFHNLWIGIDARARCDGLLIKDCLFDRCSTAAVWVSGGDDTQIVRNHIRRSSKLATGVPALNRAPITIASGTRHRIIGNDLRKADNPDALYSIDITAVPASAIELRDNDFTGFDHWLGLHGGQAESLHTQAAPWNYPRATTYPPQLQAGTNVTISGDGSPGNPFVISADGGSSSSMAIYDEGVLLGDATGINFVGSNVSVTLDEDVARILIVDASAASGCGGSVEFHASGDLLHDGQAWLSAQLKVHCARSVVYERGSDHVIVCATIGQTEFESDDGQGTVVERQVRDFLLNADDLVLGGLRVLPQAGDRIRDTDGETDYVYEVLPIGSEPAWRFSDPFRKKLRIHTKHIATESIPH